MWPPSMSQSAVVERPSRGVQKPTAADTYSTTSATTHIPRRALPSARPPAIQNTPESASQQLMRWKLRYWSGLPPLSAHSVNRLRPTCMNT